jgi:serine phosphatase RsbU (regulator of sigma subunit)
VIDRAPGADRELLRRVLAVTDAALSQLDLDALLRELLDRTCSLLGSDTAAVMLVEPETGQLVTVAAVGLEDEVRQGYRIDVGTGFSGRVAATGAPVVLERVDPDSVASPVLRRAGLRTLVGVPMVVGGEVVGVLHIGTHDDRHFDDEDVAVLQLVADRAALAGQASQRHADRTATLALQRSLMPTRLPVFEGVELAARYLPGHEVGVGGDWYDVFVLPDGELGLVVGDVSGHGLRAAVVMGRLRSALRSYALIEDDPGTVLTFLDRKIEHFEAGSLATVLYAKISRAPHRMRVSSAGHPPPLLAVRDRSAGPLSLPVDLPVGIGAKQRRRTTVVDLPRGSTLLTYTDGLIERRGEVIDAGLDRLARRVCAESAEAVCARVMAGLEPGPADDDIAVLALHIRAAGTPR